MTTRFVGKHPGSGVNLAVFTKRTFARYPLAMSRKMLLGLFRDIDYSVMRHKVVRSNATLNVKLTGTIDHLGSDGTGSGMIVLLASNIGGQKSVSPLATTRVTGRFNVHICAVNMKAGNATPCPVRACTNIRCMRVPIRVSRRAVDRVTKAAGKGCFHTADGAGLGRICHRVSGLRGAGLGIGRFDGHRRTCTIFTLVTFLDVLLRVLLQGAILGGVPWGGGSYFSLRGLGVYVC